MILKLKKLLVAKKHPDIRESEVLSKHTSFSSTNKELVEAIKYLKECMSSAAVSLLTTPVVIKTKNDLPELPEDNSEHEECIELYTNNLKMLAEIDGNKDILDAMDREEKEMHEGLDDEVLEIEDMGPREFPDYVEQSEDSWDDYMARFENEPRRCEQQDISNEIESPNSNPFNTTTENAGNVVLDFDEEEDDEIKNTENKVASTEGNF